MDSSCRKRGPVKLFHCDAFGSAGAGQAMVTSTQYIEISIHARIAKIIELSAIFLLCGV
ncbi:hypothetical protein COLO4_10002 [Corchorus olitorius]|uniref:Uncharacterized protein n=1 Tax=Corchorus olitorius TaxID=93759 RepID=A0A1R3KAB6_9ROSI|nr:hypothetical protein COLO4_10002 [Corchorus olitorius]